MTSYELVVVTHTDLDGVASAAIYYRLAGIDPAAPSTALFFTEPHKLYKVLDTIPRARRLVIADLGPNKGTIELISAKIRELVNTGVRVEWYDHHRWDESWLKLIRDAGAKLHVDTSMCAAAVVAKYAPDELEVDADEFSEKLARITCAADLWLWNEYMAGWLYRVVERYRGKKGDEWRRMMVKGFYEGSLWWPELEEALQEYIKREFDGFNRSLKSTTVITAEDCVIAGTLKHPGPPATSIVAAGLLSRYNADLAVVVRRYGTGLSLSSRRVNVREIAARLGGGGHPRAAGAPLNMPLLWKLAALLVPRLKLKWALRAVSSAVRELGGCSRLRL